MLDQVSILSARARVVLPDGNEAFREVLRVDSRRTIELRPAAGNGMASLDLERDLAIIALSASRLTEVELEWAVTANGPLPFEAWAMTPGRCQAEAFVLDAFGMYAIPDLTARNPAMGPALLMPGRYLLKANVSSGSMVLRLGRTAGTALLRAVG